MTKIRFLYDNQGDKNSASLVASNEDIDFPASNVLHPHRTIVSKQTANSSETWKWDLGTNKTLKCIVIINHNFDSGGIYKFQAHATDSWGAPTLNETLTFNSGIIVKYFNSVSLRWAQIVTTNTSSNPQIGRVFFGDYYEPTRNYDNAWSEQPIDTSTKHITEAGSEHIDVKAIYRMYNLNFLVPTEAERANFIAIVDAVGNARNMVISLDVDNFLNARTVYGRMNNMPAPKHIIGTKYEFGMSFREYI